jgi:hypothetical protein
MLTLDLHIHGKTWGDLETALEYIQKLISEEYTSGYDRNESARFNFTVAGEEEITEAEAGE